MMAYLPVLLMMMIGAIVGGVVLALTTFLGRGTPHPRKNMPFECGVPSVGDTHHPFSVKFYLVAILFLLFDVGAVFLYPLALVFRRYLAVNRFILLEMALFLTVFCLGYLYVRSKEALDWE